MIKEKEGEIIAQVKKNQKDLYESCLITDKNEASYCFYKTREEKGHGRRSQWKLSVFTNVHYITKSVKDKWHEYIDSNGKKQPLIQALMKVERTRKEKGRNRKKWVTRKETSFYVSSIELVPSLAQDVIRNHWLIENSNHYVRDVSLEEDASRIRKNPDRMAKLRSFTLNILRLNGVNNIRQELRNNNSDFNRLLTYKGLFDEKN